MLTVCKACKMLEPVLGIPSLQSWAVPLVNADILPGGRLPLSDYDAAILFSVILAAPTPANSETVAELLPGLIQVGQTQVDEGNGSAVLSTVYDEGLYGVSFLDNLTDLLETFSTAQNIVREPFVEMEAEARTAQIGFEYWSGNDWRYYGRHFKTIQSDQAPAFRRLVQAEGSAIQSLASALRGEQIAVQNSNQLSTEIH